MTALVENHNPDLQIYPGPDPEGMGQCSYGLHIDKIRKLDARGSQVRLTQLFGIVGPCLLTAQRIFVGAKRRLNYEGNQEGDKEKIFLTIKPQYSYDYVSETTNASPIIDSTLPPEGCVYVVTATPNDGKTYPDVDYWIENWSWVHEDPADQACPVDFANRYDKEVKRTPQV